MKRWKVKLPGDRYFEMESDTPHEDLAAQGYDRYALEEIYQVPPAWKELPSEGGNKAEVQYTIPADMLKYTATALYELAIRQRVSADGKTAQDAAELLKQAAEVQKAADYYSELYQWRRRDQNSCSKWVPNLFPKVNGYYAMRPHRTDDEER